MTYSELARLKIALQRAFLGRAILIFTELIIDVNLLFDENVTFLDSHINLTSNATKTSLTGSGNNYNLTLSPTDLDSSASILLSIDENKFYNTFVR